ncbi:hypothetical protein F4778DRAFT_754999 [Xylariomycetidae sp. FL2044]|nr:hypothetical protein F4778DRAFT_754999 [Xylariomycetidae sp. FL2044]
MMMMCLGLSLLIILSNVGVRKYLGMYVQLQTRRQPLSVKSAQPRVGSMSQPHASDCFVISAAFFGGCRNECSFLSQDETCRRPLVNKSS